MEDELMQNSDGRMLEAILLMTNDKTFSLTEASDIVGGESRLMELIGTGRIRGHKSGERQNARWSINASDVLRYSKIRYKRTHKQKLLKNEL
jgi:hypothetical protein